MLTNAGVDLLGNVAVPGLGSSFKFFSILNNINRSMSSTTSTMEKVAAEHAIVRMEKSNDGGTVTLTMAPGWEHVLPQTVEEDPACLIIWDDNNILATVNAFNAAIGNGAVSPEWLNVEEGNPITIPGLKSAIFMLVQVAAGGGGVVGNCMITPNNIPQYKNVCSLFSCLGFDPFCIAHVVCPIGRIYILADCRHHTTAVADPILPPAAQFGFCYAPVFA